MDSRIQGSWIQGQLWLHNEMLSQKSKQNRSLQKKKKASYVVTFCSHTGLYKLLKCSVRKLQLVNDFSMFFPYIYIYGKEKK